MQHIDDHILELHALQAEAVMNRRGEIEAHLKECHGCRMLVEQIVSSYANQEERYTQLSNQDTEPSVSLSIRKNSLQTATWTQKGTHLAHSPVRRIDLFTSFVRRHPMMMGGGSFVALAAFALFVNSLFSAKSIDNMNPVLYHYDTGSENIEILNGKGQSLWHIPSRRLSVTQEQEYSTRTGRTAIADINGDGIREVLTTSGTPDDQPGNTNPLRVYGNDGSLLFQVRLDKSISYLNRNYPNAWTSDCLLVSDFYGTGYDAIIANWSCGRSPSVVTRVDSSGQIVGEYWHFGFVSGMFPVDLNADGKPELVLVGINDVLDSVAGEFPMITVLDPSKIVGSKKSVTAPGFHLAFSDAELYYVRLPKSSLSAIEHLNEGVECLNNENKRALRFRVVNNVDSKVESRVVLEYIFSLDLKPVEVKSENTTDRFYANLVGEGKVSGTLDRAYLEDLKSKIRYWDGFQWIRGPVRITHPRGLMPDP